MSATEGSELRKALVESLKRKGDLTDPVVEAALLAVPRHFFLPDEPLERAYADDAVPVKRDSDGMVLASASQPSMIVLMLQQLQLRPGDNVLEIGAGTGYNAAIMQYIVGREGTVTSVEIDPQVAKQARINLQHAGMG
jgi:protein-L-isoaspartate(D-aspartate) O-methyltransferase